MTAVYQCAQSESFLATREVLRSQEFTSHFEADGRDWWRDVRRATDMLGGHRVDDTLILRVKSWIADHAQVHRKSWDPLVVPTVLVNEVATLLAASNPVDEVSEYLEGLRGSWDGTKRIAGGLADAMGFAASAPALALQERVWLRKWLIAGVARALRPGCQCDSALVLVGAQGLGKSSSLRLLFGDDWLHDSAIDMDSKDGASVMGTAWCVELAELASVRKASDVEAVKHFLTLRQDAFRPAYGRRQVVIPRRCVVSGTTNDATPFVDSTGSRRFWPVRVTQAFSPEWIRDNRDAIWAEAVAAFDVGEQWHLTQEDALKHAAVTREYTQADEWVDALRAFVESVDDSGVSVSQAAKSLGVEINHLDQFTQRRITTALRVLGLEKRHTESGNRWFISTKN